MPPHIPSSDMTDHDLLVEAVERLRAMEGIVSEHTRTLYGDNGDDNPGLRIRTDRLEQRAKLTGLLALGAITAAIGVLVEAIWRALSGP